jgi:hypothetical protein
MDSYSSKHALLSNVIDYAGNFPPAALPLDEAMNRAATFRKTARHPWLMGRLTSKWSDIKTFHPPRLFNCGADGVPWIFTALGTEVSSLADWERTLEWDLREIRNFNARYSGTSLKIWVVGYEAKIPELPVNDIPVRMSSYLDRFWESTGGNTDLYLEIGMGEGFENRLTPVIESVGRWMEEKSISRWTPGLKFRLAGHYKPTASEVAAAISQTTFARFKFKATQGLHSAVTHDGQFGFVNLFAALNFSQAFGSEAFGVHKIESCLKEEDPQKFEFRADRFRWRDTELSVEEIETARRFHSGSFGSCSVDEPDESLTAIFS